MILKLKLKLIIIKDNKIEQEIKFNIVILYKLILIKRTKITIQKNNFRINAIKSHFIHLCQNKEVQEKQIILFRIPSLI
jgi:hypothetical protein